MACRYAIKLLADVEIEAQSSLRPGRLLASDGQAESSCDRMDDVLEVVVIVDGSQKRGTSKEPGLRFAERYLDVVDAVLLKETQDFLGGVEGDVAGGGVVLDSDPNSDGTDNLSCAAIDIRLFPTEADEVYGGEQNLPLVEELDNLRTNVSPQNSTLLEDHELGHELWPTDGPCPIGRGRRLE